MFENVVAIKINILIVWSWPTMKIVDWQLFKAHKWVTASASAAWRAERERERGGEVCRANSWCPAMCTLKIFDSIWPQEGLCHQATFFLSSTDYFLSVFKPKDFKFWYDGRTVLFEPTDNLSQENESNIYVIYWKGFPAPDLSRNSCRMLRKNLLWSYQMSPFNSIPAMPQ